MRLKYHVAVCKSVWCLPHFHLKNGIKIHLLTQFFCAKERCSVKWRLKIYLAPIPAVVWPWWSYSDENRHIFENGNWGHSKVCKTLAGGKGGGGVITQFPPIWPQTSDCVRCVQKKMQCWMFGWLPICCRLAMWLRGPFCFSTTTGTIRKVRALIVGSKTWKGNIATCAIHG